MQRATLRSEITVQASFPGGRHPQKHYDQAGRDQNYQDLEDFTNLNSLRHITCFQGVLVCFCDMAEQNRGGRKRRELDC